MRTEYSSHSISGAHLLKTDKRNKIRLVLSLHYRKFQRRDVLGESNMPGSAAADQCGEGDDALSCGSGYDDAIPRGLALEEPDSNAETEIPCILLSSDDEQDDNSIVLLGSDCSSGDTENTMCGQAFMSLSGRSDTGMVLKERDLAPTSPPRTPLPEVERMAAAASFHLFAINSYTPGYFVAILTPLETTGLHIVNFPTQTHTLADVIIVVKQKDLPEIRVRLGICALADLSDNVTRDTGWLALLADGRCATGWSLTPPCSASGGQLSSMLWPRRL